MQLYRVCYESWMSEKDPDSDHKLICKTDPLPKFIAERLKENLSNNKNVYLEKVNIEQTYKDMYLYEVIYKASGYVYDWEDDDKFKVVCCNPNKATVQQAMLEHYYEMLCKIGFFQKDISIYRDEFKLTPEGISLKYYDDTYHDYNYLTWEIHEYNMNVYSEPR